jgi:hypothetical protein
MIILRIGGHPKLVGGATMSTKQLFVAVTISVLLVGTVFAVPQATEEAISAKVWLDRAAEFEEFLKTAEVVRTEEIGVGVTKPIRCYFAPGGLVESMTFKSIKPGRYNGYWESYKSEIAAYELDKLLGLGMIPPTVEKRVDSELGAAVMWATPTESFKQKGGVPKPPPNHAYAWNRQLSRAKMFDNLINNRDPNLGNWLVDPSWNLILIDHTRAFVSGKNMVHEMNYIDKELWDRMLNLDENGLKVALEPWLNDGRIKNLLERRDRMKEEIDEMVAKKGEQAVFIR